MTDLRFNDDGSEFARRPVAVNSGITGVLIRWGLVKTRQQATYVLVAVGILALFVSECARTLL